MKKIIVISDTHGNSNGVQSLRPLVAENDYLIHLGDGSGDIRAFWQEFPDKIYQCRGNCDFFSPLPDEDVIEIENIRIFYCHGHKYGVKSGLSALLAETKKRNCDIALYGHTHVPKITEMDGVTLINPGSLRRPVGEGGGYCYLVIHKENVTPVLVGESVFLKRGVPGTR